MPHIVVAGASGMIGQAFCSVMGKYCESLEHLTFDFLTSPQSQGKTFLWQNKQYQFKNIENYDFKNADLCFFAMHESNAVSFIEKARKHAKLIIDLSNAFRRDPKIPLIIPEINLNAWHKLGKPNLIANPNCTTIGLLLAIKPIHDLYGISRMDVATYQAISGAGHKQLTNFTNAIEEKGIHSDALDLEAQIGPIVTQNHSAEEEKMIYESQKILNPTSIPMSVGCVRVPIHTAHGAMVSIACKKKIDIKAIQHQFKQYAWIKAEESKLYRPKKHVQGQPLVYVSRIKPDLFENNRLSLWQISDNILRGGIFNAIIIAEKITAYFKIKMTNTTEQATFSD